MCRSSTGVWCVVVLLVRVVMPLFYCCVVVLLVCRNFTGACCDALVLLVCGVS